MGSPYSLDLRERVVAAVAAGMSCSQAAELYQIGRSTAIRWAKRKAETGSPAALPMGGKKPFALAEQEEWIRGRVAEKPDITGRELLAELTGRGIDVSDYAVWHFLDRAGLSFKKHCTPLNRIVPMSPEGGSNGDSGRARYPQGAWSSLMKPGRKPT